MSESALGSFKQTLSDAEHAVSGLANDAWEWMKENPKTTAAAGAILIGSAAIIGKGALARAAATEAESVLPSATALGRGMENGQGTVLGMMDDMVKSGAYKFEDGVIRPTDIAPVTMMSDRIGGATGMINDTTPLIKPSGLLKADGSEGTVAGLLDRMVQSGGYKVVGDPKSPFFIMQPVG
ncbi:MAG TPA: hypothetical protein V6C76_08285 [Drouetiella sp.]